MFAELGAIVKLFFIGVLVGLVLGVGLTVLYFSLATFFEVNARALVKGQKAAGKSDENIEDASATDEKKAG